MTTVTARSNDIALFTSNGSASILGMNARQPVALTPGTAPPQRIELGDMMIRRWQRDDLVPRLEAIVASFDHLNPWMRWLAEPTTLERQRAYGEAVASGWPT